MSVLLLPPAAVAGVFLNRCRTPDTGTLGCASWAINQGLGCGRRMPPAQCSQARALEYQPLLS